MNPLTRYLRRYLSGAEVYLATVGVADSGGAWWYSVAPEDGTRVAYDAGYGSPTAAKVAANAAVTGDDYNIGGRPIGPWEPVPSESP